MNEIAKQLLKESEGFRSKAYLDTQGVLTIGYGTNIKDGISEEEAELLLIHRYDKVKEELLEREKWIGDLDEIRKVVLFDMAYNMGVHRLLKFKKTLSYIKAGRHKEASEEMLRSRWANQVGNRAEKLSRLMAA